MLNYTKTLSELNKHSLPEAGGKGANLGELIRVGLPVPPGFVVTTGAYHLHLEESGLQERIAKRLEDLQLQDITAVTVADASRDISSWIEETPMPLQVQEAVIKALESLAIKTGSDANILVAVRSSATAEDLPSASFAGQHDTFLGICGKEAVLKHVKKCWASLWGAQAICYRISMGFEHLLVELAVVVQAMIDSEVAGVMFTANPVNQSKDEALISAGYGLGETVVSGLITPDTFILTKDGRVKEKVLGSKDHKLILTQEGTRSEKVPLSQQNSYCLGENELAQLAKLAQLVEKHFGIPQDTEWACSKGNVYLLQARPITTLQSKPEDLRILGPEDEIIYPKKKPSFVLQAAMEHFSEPLTPLDFAYFYHRYRAFYLSLQDTGLKIPKQLLRLVERESGCVAVGVGQPGVSLAIVWKAPAALLTVRSEGIEERWKPLAVEMNAWLKRMEAAARNADDGKNLAQLIEQALTEFGDLLCRRFRVLSMSGWISDFKLNRLVKKAVGKIKAAEVKDCLLRALPFRTALQNEALTKVAQVVIKGKNKEHFHREFNRFISVYGDRPASGLALLGTPTWNEKPEVIQGLIDALLSDPTLLNAEENSEKQKADYEAAKKRVEQGLSLGKYHKFEQLLEQARNEIIVREESSFMLEKLTACIRRMVLKLGGLLTAKAIIKEKDDVFYLFLDELGSAAEGKLAVQERIVKRKSALTKVCAAHKRGVHWLVSTGSIPEFKPNNKACPDKQGALDELKGLSVSSGVYEGTVCIVRGPQEFNKIKKGDILVSTHTAPVWTPLFKVAGAVVTEIGSPTSHAAIVAREYGIPAVVAIENVTSILKDGQRILVDGTKGTITLQGD
ncbi:PEP/pyruvate-binding domain-containing protein [Desulfosporosinus sp. OT]|uniref:PEP/pyruvate-binding domain-containing protein n=1 Tax=Desulfosporosinus sp. OT TaxID=913865 RepID=UPI000223ABF0|nr:PEP/pyruvate-binding domain-containing protein [Desulfosporosinus sp. OT]EGW39742.1 PEP-utilizing enzyme, mobile domain protein [Desulfosporosinus sp. OT]